MRYRASKFGCEACSLKPPARKILRSIHEGARDMAKASLRPHLRRPHRETMLRKLRPSHNNRAAEQ